MQQVATIPHHNNNSIVWPNACCYNVNDAVVAVTAGATSHRDVVENYAIEQLRKLHCFYQLGSSYASSSAESLSPNNSTDWPTMTDDRMNGIDGGHCNNSSGAATTTVNNSNAGKELNNSPYLSSFSMKMDVKMERLSPCSGNGDNNSSGSRSNSPGSTAGNVDAIPPSPSLSPVAQFSSNQNGTSSNKSQEQQQPVARNYSDIMRSLAAKYNNSNPNDYYYSTSRNGFCNATAFGDSRFSILKSATPNQFVNLISSGTAAGTTSPPIVGASMNSPCRESMTSDNLADADRPLSLNETVAAANQNAALFANFGLGSFPSAATGIPNAATNLPIFPPLVDISSTQVLLNMVRSASIHSASQLETYIKASSSAAVGKRPSPELPIAGNNPLDLSSSLSSPSSSTSSSNCCSPSAKKRKMPTATDLCQNNSDGSASSSTGTLNILQRSMRDRLQVKRSNSIANNTSNSGLAKTSATPSPATTQQNLNNCASGGQSSSSPPCSGKNSPLNVALANNLDNGGALENIFSWSVDDVCNFISSIDVCAEYAFKFREQSIDGMSLPLLTESHLRSTMNMKLGPALKLKAVLAQKLGHCSICTHCMQFHTNSNTLRSSMPSATTINQMFSPSSSHTQ